MSRKLFFTVEIIFYIGTEELKKAEGKYLQEVIFYIGNYILHRDGGAEESGGEYLQEVIFYIGNYILHRDGGAEESGGESEEGAPHHGTFAYMW